MDRIEKRPERPGGPPGGFVSQFHLPEPNLIAQMSPWSMDFRQIEPGPMQTDIRVRNGQVLSLLEINMNRGVHQQGAAPPGALTFGVPLSKGIVRWQGTEMQEKSFLTFGNDEGFDGLSDSDFHGITFSVATAEIERLADRVGIPLEECVRSSGLFRAAQGVSGVHRLSGMAKNYLDPSKSNAMDLCDEEEILTVFLTAAVRSDKLQDHSSGHQRTRAVRFALEIMEMYAEENLPISNICEAAGVSLRTMNRAFREKFGVGPKAYYLRLRMGLLRRDLIERDGSELVSDVANRWGFWHMGQLARDYRAQFGGLPSQTNGHAAERRVFGVQTPATWH